jgi:hypothetical protein
MGNGKLQCGWGDCPGIDIGSNKNKFTQIIGLHFTGELLLENSDR